MHPSPRPRTMFLTVIAALVATGVLSTGIAGAATGFGDVEADEYYSDAVTWMVETDITTGVEPGCFGPDLAITRGQVAAFLHRLDAALGNEPDPGSHPFVDVTSGYQREPVAWLYRAELTTGVTADRFAPNVPITRGDFAVLIWRYADSPRPSSALPFVDVDDTYQRSAVAWMAEEGITTGTSSSTFSPDGVVTRAQAAAFLFRFVDPDGAVPAIESEGCSRSLRVALEVGGLTANEARCAAPYLTDYDIDHLVDVLAGRATAEMDLLIAASTIGNRCLDTNRIAQLARLFF